MEEAARMADERAKMEMKKLTAIAGNAGPTVEVEKHVEIHGDGVHGGAHTHVETHATV
jgi:hypothetical protein